MSFKTLSSGLLLSLGVLTAPGLSALTLEAALARAEAHHPQLKAVAAEVRAREHEAYVAGRWENPELSLEVEDVGGSGELRGVRGAETTLAISQKLPLWQTRARVDVAEASVAQAQAEAEIALRDLRHQVTLAFIDGWEARQLAAAAKEAAARARRAEALARQRAEGGAALKSDALAARTALRLAEAEAQRAEASVRVADATLAGLLGEAPTEAPELPEALPPELPNALTLETRLAQSPEAALREVEQRLAENAVRQAEAERFPEPTLSAGVRHRREDSETSFLVGISAPLPLYGVERARVAAAEARLAQVKAAAEAAAQAQKAELIAAHATARVVRGEAETLRAEVLPAAEEACALTEATYRGGKASLLSLLEAQRTLDEARQRAAQTFAETHRTHASLRRLCGTL